MEYNTAKPELIIPEYGRGVQDLIAHSKTIENKEERQAFAEAVVDLMEIILPQRDNLEDYRTKLWSHALKIAGYDWDVELPENVNREPIEETRPQAIPYPDAKRVQHRHYGRNIPSMIDKAITIEDADKRLAYVNIILSYMKLAYESWNQPLTEDTKLLEDLKELSEGKLDYQLEEVRIFTPRQQQYHQKPNQPQQQYGRKQGGKRSFKRHYNKRRFNK